MSLVLVNLQSDEQIKLYCDNPFIIGRGSVSGCTDKRVSRNHGRLTCTVDGKLQVAALHTNPCFFMRNGIPPISQLSKGEEETLKEGDCLGLLPNAYWFQVLANKETKSIDSIKLNNENSNVLNKCSDIDNVIIKKEVGDSCNQETNSECIADNTLCFLSNEKPISSTNSQKIVDEVISVELEKTKKLPLHMYEIDEPKDLKKRDFSKQMESHLEKNKTNNQNAPPQPNSVKEENLLSLNVPSTSKILDSNSSSLPLSKCSPENKKLEEAKDGYESDVRTESPPPKRLICQYEGHCYRKNPQHKLDFSHPGDPDFIPYEERPLCNYGAACYRRRKQHKVEFRHPLPNKNLPKKRSSNSCLGEEKPPCLYGSSCSNKNPYHRNRFYHPPEGYTVHFKKISPPPVKSRHVTPKRQDSDYEEDESDLEEPFASDASSDEYLPSDSFSEEMDSSI